MGGHRQSHDNRLTRGGELWAAASATPSEGNNGADERQPLQPFSDARVSG